MRSMGVGGFLDPARLDRRRRDAAAGAALALRAARDEARARRRVHARPAAMPLPQLPGTRTRAGLLGAARALDHAPPGALPRRRRRAPARRRDPGVRAAAHAGLGGRHPALAAGGAAASTCSATAVGPGALSPSQVSSTPAAAADVARAAVAARRSARLVDAARRPIPRSPRLRTRRGRRFVDPTRRYAQVIVAGAARVRRRAVAALRQAAARRRSSPRRASRRACGVLRRRRPAAGRRLPPPLVQLLPVARARPCSC